MNKFTKFALAASAAIFTLSAQADSVPAPKPYSAYVQDANGMIVHDAFGDCVHTGYWTPKDAVVVGCDGVLPPPPPAPAPPPPPAPAPAPVAAPAPVVAPVPVSEKVTYSADAFFDFDKSIVKPEGKAKLDYLTSKLKDMNLEVIVAVGHTDSIGTVEYNQKLSVRRAEAVKKYLISKGVEAKRVYTEGKGKKQPIADNKTSAGRAKNRRVEVEVVGTHTVMH
ncbi:MAG: outer membrane protein OmpA [Burkholderiales bacterium]